MKQILMTQDGLEKMQEEYETLKQQRPNAVEHLKKAREMGDLSENGYYKASRARLSFIDSRLFHLKNVLKRAAVVKAETKEYVSIGCTVTVKQGGVTRNFTVVGSYEADPSVGKLSHISPIGRELLGKRVGDDVVIRAPAGEKVYTIVEIIIGG